MAFFVVLGVIFLPPLLNATGEEKPLFTIKANSAESLAEQWNNALANGENNILIQLTGNIDLPESAHGEFGTGVGFANGGLYVKPGVKLQLDLNNCRLNQGGYPLADGRIIYNEGTLLIKDSSNGTATHSFTYQGKTYTVRGGTLMGGTTLTNGGGIINGQGGNLEITGGTIANCNAIKSGGAIYAQAGSTTKISGGTFAYNRAEANGVDGEVAGGGAVFVSGDETSLVITGGAFEHNSSQKNGGAILVGSTTDLQVTTLNLTENTALVGGGLCSYAVNATIQNVVAKRNVAHHSGGAVAVAGGVTTIANGIFQNNTAQQDASYNGVGVGGGAVAVVGGELNLQGTRPANNQSNFTFDGNVARFGGAIATGAGTLNATGLVFGNNTANHGSMAYYGGAVATSGGTATYTDCYFSGDKLASNSSGLESSGVEAFAGGGDLIFDGGVFEKMTGNATVYTNKASNIKFTGGVIIQYNMTLLYSSKGNTSGTVTFDDAIVQYNGYASETDYKNQSSTGNYFRLINISDGGAKLNMPKVIIRYNKNGPGVFIRSTSGNGFSYGTPNGTNDDVQVYDNIFDTFFHEQAYGINYIYHGTWKNNRASNDLFNLRGYSTGNTYLQDGVFTNNSVTNQLFNLYKTNIDWAANGHTLHISGGEFSNHTLAHGLILSSNSAVNISGGVFNNNTATQSGYAGVVTAVYSNDTITFPRRVIISGGTFTNNKSISKGGAIYVNHEKIKVNISGGTFTGNQAYYSMANCVNPLDGGAIYTDGETTISGKPVIKNNTTGTNKLTSNLATAKALTIGSPMTAGADVHVAHDGKFTTGWGDFHTTADAPSKYFTSDRSGYKITRIGNDVVAVTSSTNTDKYLTQPTAVATTPSYNGKAQAIITGYDPNRMKITQIKHTWFDGTNQATLNTADVQTITTAFASYVSGQNIIVTDAGQWAVTVAPLSGYQWFGGGTSAVTITATMNKYFSNLQVDNYNRPVYTGEVITSCAEWRPTISDDCKTWLAGWTNVTTTNDYSSLTFGKDATGAGTYPEYAYHVKVTPQYVGNMGRNYYVPNIKMNFSVTRVQIATDSDFTVVVDEAQYKDGSVDLRPAFKVYFRNYYLGQYDGSKWIENSARPCGPVNIKDIVYVNNREPNRTDNQPAVTFSIDTGYNTVCNFEGTRTTLFTINGRPITNDGTGDGLQINGHPEITTNKTYDGTVNAAIVWEGKVTVSGVSGVYLTVITATYDSSSVGTDKTITIKYFFGGANGWLYSYSETCQGTITPAVITQIDGLVANKTYDGTVDATLSDSNAVFTGKFGNDNLRFTADVAFVAPGAGENKQMVIDRDSLVLSGSAAGNYVLADDVVINIDGTILPASLTATADGVTTQYDSHAHDMIKPNFDSVVLTAGATDADRASVVWEYSLDQTVWETNLPTRTRAANVPVYYRVKADNHDYFYGEVRFALTPISIADAQISLGQSAVIYDGAEHNLVPYITFTLGDETLELKYAEDYLLEYQNSYQGGDYDNGKGDTKNVGVITVKVIGSGQSFMGTAKQSVTFQIVPQTVAMPAADTRSFHYNGSVQTYEIATDERYVVTGNQQSEVSVRDEATQTGGHAVTVALVDKHNYTWENGSTADLTYWFSIYAELIEVNWEWAYQYYYVGKSYTAADALAGTTASSQHDANTKVPGTVSFSTADGLLTIVDPDNAHKDTLQKTFTMMVEAKFTPDNPSYAPVVATLPVSAKWIVVTLNSNRGSGSANLEITARYGDPIIYIDYDTNDNKLTRDYYLHLGWTRDTAMDPVSARDFLTENDLTNYLQQKRVVDLNGETFAEADATYYAVWRYIDYTITFYKNEPLQYKTLSDDAPETMAMFWTPDAATQFVTEYNGVMNYDQSKKAYIYTYNHQDWLNKTSDVMRFNLPWVAGQGFTFKAWQDGAGTIVGSLNSLKNLELYAQWEGLKYTVNFVNRENEEEITQTARVQNGGILTANQIPNLLRVGYNFAGWFLTPEAAADVDANGALRVLPDETTIWTTRDLTLYAGWTAKRVHVQIDTLAGMDIKVEVNETQADGSEIITKTVYSGDLLYLPSTFKISAVVKPGYQFKNLTLNFEGQPLQTANDLVWEYTLQDYSSDKLRIDLIISGAYDVCQYDLNYAPGAWQFVADFVAPNTYSVENNVTLPVADNMVYPGYTFAGWYDNNHLQGAVLTNTRELTDLGNVTLYPKWTANQQTLVLYNGGVVYATRTLTTDSEYRLDDLSTLSGFEDYNFQGWSLNADLTGAAMPSNAVYTVQPANNNLYAVWQFKEGELTIHADRTEGWYDFGRTVLTLTPAYSREYVNLRNGIKVSYEFYRTGNDLTPVATGTLSLTDVAQNATYYCVATVTDNGYAQPLKITSESIAVRVLRKNLSDAVFAEMSNQTYTGAPITPDLPEITVEGWTLVPGVDFTYEYYYNETVGWAHLKITGLNNYSGSADQPAFYIEPAYMNARVEANHQVYDGAEHLTVINQWADVENVTWTYSLYGEEGSYATTVPVAKDAGEYKIYFRVSRTNYKTYNGSVVMQITPKLVEVNWADLALVYNAQNQKPTATVVTGVDGDSLTLTVTAGDCCLVGTYTATAGMTTLNRNYQLTNTQTEFTIQPREVTVNITPHGNWREGEVGEYATASLNNLVGGDNPEIFLTYYLQGEAVNGKPATEGAYVVRATIIDSNYILTGLTEAPFTIRKKDGTVTNSIIVQQDDWHYGDPASTINWVATVGHDEAQITYFYLNANNEEVALNFNDITMVGTYYVRVVIEAISADTDEENPRTYAEATKEFHILPRVLSLAWTDLQHEYDGEKHTPNVTLTNLIDGDECQVNVVTEIADGVTVGDYWATVTKLDNENYVLPEITAQQYSILPRAITVTIDAQESVYGDDLNILSAQVTAGDIIPGDNFDGSVYTLNKETGTDVGTYAITGTSTNSNYTVTFVDAIYTITPKECTVVWEDIDYVYNGEVQTIMTYLMHEDEKIYLSVNTMRDAMATPFLHAGEYQVTAVAPNDNFCLSNATTTVTIVPTTLLIIANDLSVRYDQEFTLTAEFIGFVNDEDVSDLDGNLILETTYQLRDNITGDGTYPITASGLSSDDYVLNYQNGTLTVEGVYLQIRIKNRSSIYGNGLAELEFDFVDLSLMNPGRVFELVKDDGLTVGEYAIRGRILNRNYSIDFIREDGFVGDGVYTILPRPITVAIDDKTDIYNKTMKPEFEATVIEGSIANDDNADGSVYQLLYAGNTSVGTYQIHGVSTNANYTVTFVAATDPTRAYGLYTVSPKKITIPTADLTEFVYTGNPQTYRHDWLYRDYYTLSGDDFTQTDAGNYVITLTLDENCVWADAETGHEHDVLRYEFNIAKAEFPLTNVTANGYQGVYDGQAHDALVDEEPANDGEPYTWEFSVAGSDYTATMPTFTIPGTYMVDYRLVSTNYATYYGNFTVQITKAKLTVTINQNSVAKGTTASLDQFTVTGLATNDRPGDVVQLIYQNDEYSTSDSETGDEFALTAVLRDGMNAYYEIEYIEPNVLLVTEAPVNVGLIIGLAAGGVVVVGGGVATAVISIRRKRKISK